MQGRAEQVFLSNILTAAEKHTLYNEYLNIEIFSRPSVIVVCCTFQKVLIDCGIIRPLIVRMMEIKLSGLIIKGAETEGNHLGIYVLYSTIGLCLHICYQNCIIHTSLENELCKHNNNIIIIISKVHTTIHPHTKVMEFLR